jgi:hypothetical protein
MHAGSTASGKARDTGTEISLGSSNPIHIANARNQASISVAVAPSLGGHGMDGRYTGEVSTNDCRLTSRGRIRHRIPTMAKPTSGAVSGSTVPNRQTSKNRARKRRQRSRRAS